MVILVLCYKKSSICLLSFKSKTRLVTVLKNTRKGNFQKPSKKLKDLRKPKNLEAAGSFLMLVNVIGDSVNLHNPFQVLTLETIWL
jgi:hypothetical protein